MNKFYVIYFRKIDIKNYIILHKILKHIYNAW